jgi:hypothetical protein
MKFIIAGGRSYRFTASDRANLDALHPIITEVVSGHCPTGADKGGEDWAKRNRIPVKEFPADWYPESHGGKLFKGAGPVRNRRMAQYVMLSGGGCLIAFPGGDGTANMVEEAHAHGLTVYDWRNGVEGTCEL